ncbi:MAG: DUF2628 domain-containing protein [Ruminococcus sp.]|nr:DUF2628 domain-containing protein [Ruminococcus sp.]
MADYRNCTCIGCKNTFEADDDIVVCPECGTPYHRDCWNAHGHCINTELHETGGSWQRPKTEEEIKAEAEANAPVPCPNCGSKNDRNNIFCTQCGSSMKRSESLFGDDSTGNEEDSWTGRFSGIMGMENTVNSNEEIDGVKMQDVVDFVGKNTPYYISRFRFFRDQKKKIAPNFVCMVFPQLWFAYRKMWLFTAIIIIAAFLLSIPGSLISLASQTDALLATLQPQMAMAGEEFFKAIQEQLLSFAEAVKENYRVLYWTDFVCNYISMAMNIVLFLFGNYIYYRHAVKKIKAVRNDNRSLIDVQSRIRMAGGANVGFVILALLAEFALTSVLSYIIMFV